MMCLCHCLRGTWSGSRGSRGRGGGGGIRGIRGRVGICLQGALTLKRRHLQQR